MNRIRVWLLPLALAAAQLAIWPGAAGPASGAAVATGVAVTLVVAVALLWRRSAPLPVLCVVVVAMTVGEFGVPADVLALIGIADLIVLYNIAVWRGQRLTLCAAAGTVAWQCALIATRPPDPDVGYPLDVAVTLVVYATVVAFGRARNRWHRERAGAAARLAEAEDRRARAADTERHRLARELHDVTAHHLTSIVVIASAAQRLGGARPELVAEARDFAARTGRDTLAALHRLVDLLRLPDERPGPAAQRLAELAEGFRLLGQPVTVQAEPGDLPGPAAEAAVGIAREALTNTLRYAPGSAVRIRLVAVDGGTELTVDDDGARAPGVTGVGSGRGIAGMRERAAALGGTLAAGPRPAGGWRVRLVLPPASAAPPVAGARWRPGAERVIDLMLLLLAMLLPLGVLLAADDDPAVSRAPVALLLIVVLGSSVPIAWRRSHPWVVLAAVTAAAWAWPLLIVAGLVPHSLGWVILTCVVAEIIAVYAVARYARSPGLSALSIPAALTVALLAAAALVVLDPSLRDDEVPPEVELLFISLAVGIPLGVPVVGAWVTGYLVGRRHGRILAEEHDAVAAATAQALAAAASERVRVAAGLRAAVLRDTARVATAADEGDLDQVLSAARAALGAMRGLLSGLRDDPDASRDPRDRDPQPTVAALPGLAERWRAGGREVDLDLREPGRRLPPEVDLSAFRVVELLLAGDTGPVSVRADLTGDPLRIAVRPMPADPGGEVAAGLRARLAAVGGTMETAADGGPEILLPAPTNPDGNRPDQSQNEEVASSPSG
ncbi:histidine kinase [Actinoplanes sp. NPDC049118]|uniref:ATP-binding protein n=1 Tax=Actinoplanes sp. NPDC049118 TaxID=3155769 RepID=UPI003402098C